MQQRSQSVKTSSSRISLVVIGLVSLLLIGAGVGLIVRHMWRAATPAPGLPPAPPTQTVTPGEDAQPPIIIPTQNPPPPPASNEDATPLPTGSAVPGFAEVSRKYPLFVAIIYGKLDDVRKLVEQNPSVVKTREPGQQATPLQWAVAKEQTAIVAYLLEHGAEVDARGKTGWTSLHAAAFLGNAGIVKLLLDHGANINAVDRSNGTALFKAVGRKHTEAATLLLARRPAVNVREKDQGLTALHEAVLQYQTTKDLELVRQLLKQGADVTIKDMNGTTPLKYAEMMDQPDLIALLKKAGAKR